MITFKIVLVCLLFCIIGYLLGNILLARFVAKLYDVNIYRIGSQNPGATNVWRSISKLWGFAVAVSDALKSYVAVIISWKIYTVTIYVMINNVILGSLIYLAGLFALIGHCFPITCFFRKNKQKQNYKGGKGVATYGGILFSMSPWIALACFGFWLIVIFLTRYVSVASMFMMLFAIGIIFLDKVNWFYLFTDSLNNNGDVSSYEKLIFFGVCACILFLCCIISVYMHRKNIILLLTGKERRVNERKKEEK